MTSEDFRMEVTGHFSRPIARQSQEGVALSAALKARDQGEEVELMNSRNDFLQPGVVQRRFSGILS